MPTPSKPVVTKNWILLVTGAVALIVVIIFRYWVKWNPVSFAVTLASLTSNLAPVALAAAVVERAVEILVSPWRDPGASKLDKAMAAVKARPVDASAIAQNAADLQEISDKLDEYRGKTQQYAFAISLSLSILASIAGVRALGPFVDGGLFYASSTLAQQLFFRTVDMALSAALLAGGADGVHSVVNAVTSFFDTSSDKMKQ